MDGVQLAQGSKDLVLKIARYNNRRAGYADDPVVEPGARACHTGRVRDTLWVLFFFRQPQFSQRCVYGRDANGRRRH